MQTNIQPIEQLFDPVFASAYLTEHAPNFAASHNLSDLSITPIKRNIGEKFYHVVIRYQAASFGDILVFCSAHSQENREQAYEALTFINEHGFKAQKVFLPKPLFFEKKFNAFFYQGMEGKTLLTFIRKPDTDLSEYLNQTAYWIAQLHQVDTQDAKNFNPDNSQIKTILPGPERFLPKIKKLFPEYYKQIKTVFEKLVTEEEQSLTHLPHKYLIHGDFHPENVIINKTDGKISAIDFTDICLGDWARDVGGFMQQLEFMSAGFHSQEKIEALQKLFVEYYCTHRSISLLNEDWKRIRMYQIWTALRSAIYFLTKAPAEPKEAKAELTMVQQILKNSTL
ncbi:hypothetical protein BK004_03015 [bacterium CG10_46_32]|nr:MAG: hypothetical protein BK004_03015 [bacterium CG10_46_32]PIR56029.1 MAG: hypothetical protein COU73_03050 [Parcubacteria group bacterium CG10_big_fil_rev_8_21_14_0_10_46_32]